MAHSKTKFDAVSAARTIFSLIRTDMDAVESEYERQISSNIQFLDHLGKYLKDSGGKRVRPALLLLSYRSVLSGVGEKDVSAVRLASVMEMLHTATLVHDDIIDNADRRRNRPSINSKFGNQTAVLIGDWLYMSAFETSLAERDLEILDILTRLTRLMTEGELIQLTVLGSTRLTVDDYFDILRRKTAYLFSACCEIGALLAGASVGQREALRDYGLNLGMAFQLADDVLDFVADDGTLGKKAGVDLLEGKLTLPLLLYLEKNPEATKWLEDIMLNGAYGPLEREGLLEKLLSSGVIEETRRKAFSFAEAARKNLDVLQASEYRNALEEIPIYMIEREK
ncbi:MAG: polyprenyl synthetase family protein [Acidobacteriota bacterium]